MLVHVVDLGSTLAASFLLSGARERYQFMMHVSIMIFIGMWPLCCPALSVVVSRTSMHRLRVLGTLL